MGSGPGGTESRVKKKERRGQKRSKGTTNEQGTRSQTVWMLEKKKNENVNA